MAEEADGISNNNCQIQSGEIVIFVKKKKSNTDF